MAPSSPTRSQPSSTLRATLTLADTAAWYCSIILVSSILIIALLRDSGGYPSRPESDLALTLNMRGPRMLNRPCDEIYVVGEGETLHTISDKCGDPFIVERNPHIHDPDDVFPGLVIRIMPLTAKANGDNNNG